MKRSGFIPVPMGRTPEPNTHKTGDRSFACRQVRYNTSNALSVGLDIMWGVCNNPGQCPWAACNVTSPECPHCRPMFIHAAQLRSNPPHDLMNGRQLMRTLEKRSACTTQADCSGGPNFSSQSAVKDEQYTFLAPGLYAWVSQVHEVPAPCRFLYTGLPGVSCMDREQVGP